MTDKEIEIELDSLSLRINRLYEQIDELEKKEVELTAKLSPEYRGFYK